MFESYWDYGAAFILCGFALYGLLHLIHQIRNYNKFK